MADRVIENTNGLNNVYGNIWIFPVKLEAGKRKKGHKHEFDHVHMAVSGSATIHCFTGTPTKTKLLYKVVMEAGKYYRVPKEHIHSIHADQGGDYHGSCIHAVRHVNGDPVETAFVEAITEGNIEFKPDED